MHVLDFLADLSQHALIYPLVVSVEELEVPEEQFRRYRTTDRVRRSPGIILHNTTSAIPKGDGTLLWEEVSVKAPFLLGKNCVPPNTQIA
mgnify:CR=1 FL=1